MIYVAVVTREGKNWLADFPDAPGCQTFATSKSALQSAAQEALEGWLETSLEFGDCPRRPRKRVHLHVGAASMPVAVSPKLAVALQVRWARTEARLSQERLARLAGMNQQAIARLESSKANPTVSTLARIAGALGKGVDFAFETK